MRVLIVDDNATNLETLNGRTGAWKLRMTGATDSHEALRQLRAGIRSADPFQLVVLDMEMTGMDGLALAETIRRETAPDCIQLIALSSLGHQRGHETLATHGIAACLVKPLSPSLLLEYAAWTDDQPKVSYVFEEMIAA
jgi:CheY-like chemotaxis protein